MANPFFSGRIPPELDDRVNQYLAETGMKKTELLVEALAKYIDVPIKYSPQPSLSQTLEEHEKRIRKLEDTLITADNKSSGVIQSKEEGVQLTALPVVASNSAPKEQWMTTLEAYEYCKTSLSLDRFRRIDDERLKTECGLIRDYSRKPGRGRSKSGQWIRQATDHD